MCQKRRKRIGIIECIYEYCLKLVRRLQIRIQFNIQFLEHHLASICWWIPSSCGNHCHLIHCIRRPSILIQTCFPVVRRLPQTACSCVEKCTIPAGNGCWRIPTEPWQLHPADLVLDGLVWHHGIWIVVHGFICCLLTSVIFKYLKWRLKSDKKHICIGNFTPHDVLARYLFHALAYVHEKN